MFSIDEVVVYNQYVCKIKSIKTNSMIGKDYYVMNPVDDESLIIYVPEENRLGNIKRIMSKQEAELFIQNIPNVETLKMEDKYILQKYKELMNSSSKEDLVKIIKTSYLRNDTRKNNNKKVSEIDDTYLKKAEKLLYNELVYSLNMSYDDVREYITNYCIKNNGY